MVRRLWIGGQGLIVLERRELGYVGGLTEGQANELDAAELEVVERWNDVDEAVRNYQMVDVVALRDQERPRGTVVLRLVTGLWAEASLSRKRWGPRLSAGRLVEEMKQLEAILAVDGLSSALTRDESRRSFVLAVKVHDADQARQVAALIEEEVRERSIDSFVVWPAKRASA